MFLRVGDEIIDIKRVKTIIYYSCGILDLFYEDGEEERIRILEYSPIFEISSDLQKSENKI